MSETTTPNNVAIVGVGYSEIGRRLERPLGLLAVDAARAAVADAGLTLADIDGVSTFPMFPSGNTGETGEGISTVGTSWMIHNLGMSNVRWWAESQMGNISTSIEQAAMAIEAGRCDYALVWRAMHMPQTGSYHGSWGQDAARGAGAFTFPYGHVAAAPMGYALSYMRYLKLYGAERKHLGTLAVAQRKGANLNPRAFFRDKPLTLDEYLNARMIADPMCLFDCDIPVDGAAAIVLTRADRAKDLPHPPAYITGLGQAGYLKGTAPINLVGQGPGLFEEMYNTAESLGAGIWKSSGLRPDEVNAAMLYDGWAPDVYFWLEGLGFCGRGEAWQFIQDGRIDIDGDFPINTFGGNLSEGRLHGMGHWIEATLQIQGRAGKRQIRTAENILVATGLTFHGSGAMLSRNPR